MKGLHGGLHVVHSFLIMDTSSGIIHPLNFSLMLMLNVYIGNQLNKLDISNFYVMPDVNVLFKLTIIPIKMQK